MVAKTYEKLGELKNATEWAQVTLQRSAENVEDEEIMKEAKQVLKRVSR